MYAPRQDVLEGRPAFGPHGGRTPGRGPFRTPFSIASQSRLARAQPQPAGMTNPLPESELPGQVAMTAESSADATSTAEIMSNLEALSLTGSLSAQRLSPIVTNSVLSPSDVILASSARSHASEGQRVSAALAPAQMSQPESHGQPPLLHEAHVSDAASLTVLDPQGGSETANDSAPPFSAAQSD